MCLIFDVPVAHNQVITVKEVSKQEQLSKEVSHRDSRVKERETRILEESKESLKELNSSIQDISKMFNLKRVEG